MDAFDALRAIAALMLVVGLMLGLGWGLRRYGGSLGIQQRRNPGDLSVIETRAIDARRRLAVIRWGDAEHLICIGPAGDVLIATRPAPPETPDAQQGPGA